MPIYAKKIQFMNGKTNTDYALKNINLWRNLTKSYEGIVNNFYKSYSALNSAAATTLKFYRGEIKHETFFATAKEALSVPLDLVKCLLFFGLGAITAVDSINAAITDITAILGKGEQLLSEGNYLFSSPEHLQHKINDLTGIKLKSGFATNLTDTYNATQGIAHSLKNISNIIISNELGVIGAVELLKSTATLLSSAITLNTVYTDVNSLCDDGIGACLPKLVDDIEGIYI